MTNAVSTQVDAEVLERVPAQLYINGQWRPSGSGSTFAVVDPATGVELVRVADAGPADGLSALDAAAEAQEEWRGSSPQLRADVLHAAYELIVERADELALLMTLEMGKSIAESRGEVNYSAQFLRWFSEEAVRIDGRWSTAPDGMSRVVTLKQPVGPCLLITAWNFPLALAARKVGAAIAAGCTMVLKPAHQTPLSALAFAEILHQVGLPPGILNVVPTTNAAALTEPLLADARLRKLSFTGSTAVGKALMAKAAGCLLRTSMELGGNAPFIVFDDADVDAAVDGALVAKLRNVGEACTAANRFYVHSSNVQEFTRKLTERVRLLRVGPGRDPATDIGPLIDDRQRDSVSALVDDALNRGAKLHTGGAQLPGGSYYAPTVLSGISAGSRMLDEEIFGPVAPVISFDSEQEVLSEANRTEYGLVAYVYTRSLDRAVRMTERLEFGMVAVNRGLVSNPVAPFGGIKGSGMGREGGPEGIEEYLETKYLALDTTQ